MLTAIPQTFVRRPARHAPANVGEHERHTRSGKVIGSPIYPGNPEFSRRSHSPKPRKASRKARSGKTSGPILDQPLSILTQDYKVPVKDMAAWVSRSLEERRREVEKKKGYISRPMNSFMLYRSAYADRVKQFCKENNHQVVSQVTGASWPLEPREVREMYERYAAMERDNHQAAHPHYKFAPNKANKKRAQDEEDDAESDPEWTSSQRPPKRHRPDPVGERQMPQQASFEQRGALPPVAPPQRQHVMYPVAYQFEGAQGHPTLVMGPTGYQEQYYPPPDIPYGQYSYDLAFEKRPLPAYDHPLVGLPEGGNQDLLDDGPHSAVPVHSPADLVDPRLAQLDPGMPYHGFEGLASGFDAIPRHGEYHGYPPNVHGMYPALNYHPGNAMLTDAPSLWISPNRAGAAFDEELRKWNGNALP